MASELPVESYHIELLKQHDDYMCSYFGATEDLPDLLSCLKAEGVLESNEIQRLLKRMPDSYDVIKGLLPILKRKKADVFLKFLGVLKQRAEFNQIPEYRTWKTLNTLIQGLEGRSVRDFRVPVETHLIETLEDLRTYVQLRNNNEKKLAGKTHTAEYITPYKLQWCDIETKVVHKKDRLFYSSIHGVSVNFLPTVFTVGISEFKVSMGVCDPMRITLPLNFVLCTPVIWLDTEPQGLVFPENSIHISLPHCANITCIEDANSLAVLSLPNSNESPKEKLDFSKADSIQADFSDGYYAIFCTSHFTHYSGTVDLSKRKRPRFEQYDNLIAKHSTPFLPPVKKSNSVDDDKTVLKIVSYKPGSMPWSGYPLHRKPKNMRSRRQHSLKQSHDPSKPIIPVPLEVESKFDQPLDKASSETVLRVELTCVLPKNRSKSFRFGFFAHLSLPTVDVLLQQAISLIFKNEVYKTKDIDLYGSPDPLKLMTPELIFELMEDSNLNGWIVLPIVDKLPAKMLLSAEALSHYDEATKLPRILFTAIDDDATGKLLCNVLVRGEFADNSDLGFEISSTVNDELIPEFKDYSTSPSTTVTINIDINIFEPSSSLLRLLKMLISSSPDSLISLDLNLDLDIIEHHTFIVCTSYKLARWKLIAQELKFEESDVELFEAKARSSVSEQAYQMLCHWTAMTPNPSIVTLFHALRACNVSIALFDGMNRLREQFQLKCYGMQIDEHFIRCRLSQELCLVWKSMGRLLGLSWKDVESLKEEGDCSGETLEGLTCNMLLKWKQTAGYHATYDRLVHSLLVMRDLDPISVNGACRATKNHLHLFDEHCYI